MAHNGVAILARPVSHFEITDGKMKSGLNLTKSIELVENAFVAPIHHCPVVARRSMLRRFQEANFLFIK
jgi:hypothetical protein